jgi:hypothetical protein
MFLVYILHRNKNGYSTPCGWVKCVAVICIDFKLPPFSECCVLSFALFRRRVVFNIRRFETLCLLHLHGRVGTVHIHSPMKMEQKQCSETSAVKHHTPAEQPKVLHEQRNFYLRRLFSNISFSI